MKYFKSYLILLIYLFSFPVSSDSNGPLEIHNMYPPFLGFLSMTPTSTDTTPHEKFTLSYNTAWVNTTQTNVTMTKNITMDMETLSFNVAAEYGLSKKSDIRVDFWLLYFFPGILDEVVRDFHYAFDFPNGDRENYADFQYKYKFNDCGKDFLDYNTFKNQYAFKKSFPKTRYSEFLPFVYREDNSFPIQNNFYDCGNTVLNVPSGSRIGDSSIRYKRKLKSETKLLPSVSSITALRIPLGSRNLGYRGSSDVGTGIALQKSWHPFNMFLNISYIYPFKRKYFNSDGVKIRNYFQGTLGFEYFWKDDLSVIIQFIYLNSPLKTKLKELGDNSTQVAFGIAQQFDERLKFNFVFVEDLSYYTTPDFSFHFGARYSFSQ